MKTLPRVTDNPSRWCWGFLLAAIFLFSSPLFARTWEIAHFNARYTVSEDSSVIVEEEIHPSFHGSYNGIERTLPVEYPGPDGTSYKLYLTVVSVTDENGGKIRYEQSMMSERQMGGGSGRYLKLRIYAGGEDTERTVRITYRAANAIRFFKDHDEFYWNVTGNDWKVPIDSATAFVALPAAATGKVQVHDYTGAYGSSAQDATNSIDGSNVSFEATHPLPPRSGLTIALWIPKGVLHQPSALTRFYWFIGGNPGVLLPVWSFLVMFCIWYWKGRDPDAGLSVAPMYEPPKDMTPAECGTLLEDKIESRDITCTLIDLAVKGYLKIIETEEKGLIFKNKDYILRLMKPRPEWPLLAAHEIEILNNLFPEMSAEETTLSSLKNRFYVALPSIRQEIMGALKTKGVYAVDPETANGLAVMGVLVIAIPVLWLQMTGHINLFNSIPVLIGGVLLSALFVFFFAHYLSAKTLLGARLRVQCLGFKEFMTRVDADRLKRMPPDTFEKFLPYAMAFGVEQLWAKAFEGLITDPPSWYVGSAYGPGFLWNPLLFAASVGNFGSTAFETFSAAPQASSSGSAFGGDGGGFGGGGGFSGGGFGGGGGDAF
ncbi:MAG: DUF2207 domain-containing protein [Acidobacteriota bacterium]|nr:DUF2207 domain-containing protein [Acidobacteriota bacterium]